MQPKTKRWAAAISTSQVCRSPRPRGGAGIPINVAVCSHFQPTAVVDIAAAQRLVFCCNQRTAGNGGAAGVSVVAA